MWLEFPFPLTPDAKLIRRQNSQSIARARAFYRSMNRILAIKVVCLGYFTKHRAQKSRGTQVL